MTQPENSSLEALATEISVICAEWAVAMKSGLYDQAAFQQLMQPHILLRLKWHAQVEEFRRHGLLHAPEPKREPAIKRITAKCHQIDLSKL